MSNSDGMRMGSIVFNMLNSLGNQEAREAAMNRLSDRVVNQMCPEQVLKEVVRQTSPTTVEATEIVYNTFEQDMLVASEVLNKPTVESAEGISHWGIHLEDKPEAPIVVTEALVPLPEVPTTAITLTTITTNIDLEAKTRAVAIQDLMRLEDFGYMAQEDVMTVKPIVVASGSTVLCFWRQKAGTGQGRKIGPKLYLSPKNSITENDELIKAAYELYRAYGRYE
jgi:hypothetical protein